MPFIMRAARLVDAHSGTELSLAGSAVITRRECTRDADWRLLQAVLHDLQTGGQVCGRPAAGCLCWRTPRCNRPCHQSRLSQAVLLALGLTDPSRVLLGAGHAWSILMQFTCSSPLPGVVHGQCKARVTKQLPNS